MMTARAQPFAINIIDGVKPFESPRPARKPRTKGANASSASLRKSGASVQSKGPPQPKARVSLPELESAADQEQGLAPRGTRHYALRLETITLGPSLAPQAVEEPKMDVASPPSRRHEILRRLSDLTRPVTLAPERRQAIMWCGAVFALGLALAFAGLHQAVGQRQQSELRMSQIERQIAVRTHNVTVRARDVSEAHAIDNTNAGSRDLDRVLADLAWTEAAKAPDARLRSWSWSPEQLIAEANRPAAFVGADRPVRRRSGPVKRGAWSFEITQPVPRPNATTSTTRRIR